MEFLRFMFSNYWIWLGFIILFGLIGDFIVDCLKAIFSRKEEKDEQTDEEETD